MAELNSKLSMTRVSPLLLCATYLLSGCSQVRDETQRTIVEHEGSIRGLVHEGRTIPARAGDVFRVVLQQTGLDLYLEYSPGPDGKAVRFESFTGRFGEERVIIAVQKDGPITLTYGAVRNPEVSGQYRLLVTKVPKADLSDVAYSDASRQQEVFDLIRRLELLQLAAAEYARSQSWREQGLAALARINLLNEAASDSRQAIESGEMALSAFRRTSSPQLRAVAANGLAWAYGEAKNIDRMKESFAEARSQYGIAASPIGLAEVDLYEATASSVDLDSNARLSILRRVTDECAKLHESICKAQALSSIGSLLQANGSQEQAFDAFYHSLSLVDADADSATYAQMNDNLAFNLRMLGDFDGAIHHLRISLAAYSKFGECGGVSRSLYGLGYTMLGVGDEELAMRFYRLALSRICTVDKINAPPDNVGIEATPRELCEAATAALEDSSSDTDRSVSTWATYDLGNLARTRADHSAALLCHEISLRLAESRSNSAGDRIGAKVETVKDLIELGRTEEAQKLYEKMGVSELGNSHAWYRAQGAEVEAMLSAVRGERVALDRYRDAATMMKAAGNSEGAYLAFRRRALLARDIGVPRLDDYFADADEALENVRMMSFDPTYSASLFAAGRAIYEDWIESRLARRGDGSAQMLALHTLAISERSRARLLAQLASASRGGSEARAARASFLSGDLAESLRRAEAGEPPSLIKQQDGSISTESLTSASARQIAVDTRFGASATKEAIRRLRVFQNSMDPEIAIVEYALGETRSYAWVLRRDHVSIVELDPARSIRDAAAAARTAIEQTAPIEDAKIQLGRLHALIVEPILKDARGSTLAVVPDDVLHDVPFAALWDAQNGRFLIETRSIIYLPSIHFVASREMASGDRGNLALLVGDPVYNERDASQRCRSTSGAAADGGRKVGFERIPASGREVQAVEAVFRDRLASPNVLLGCAATRERIVGGSLAGYRYIHFATHATADRVVPQRSAIYLSVYDDRGRPVSPVLAAADVLDLHLTADLVVLSGCSTAGGRQFRGEGALGLSFSLLASGSRQVLSTLWPVADSASSSAMRKLYESLLVERVSAASALRLVQLEMLAGKRWKHPRHWAAYSLLGM